MARETLHVFGEKIRKEENPKQLLAEIFRFINFKPANIDLYFLLLDSQEPLTVRDICKKLDYSERTIRKYIKELLNTGYITRKTVERDRPCYAYYSIPPAEVWKMMVNEVRDIRKRAGKKFED